MYTSVLIGTPGTLGWPRVCDVVQAGVQRVCTYATMENEREANGGSCLKLAASRVYRLERAWINERSNNRKWSPRRYSRDGGERERMEARFGASPPVETLPTLWTGALISS